MKEESSKYLHELSIGEHKFSELTSQLHQRDGKNIYEFCCSI